MRRTTWIPALLSVAAAVIVGAVPGQPAGKQGDHHARARLVAESAWASPGGTVNLGVTFDIDPKWHLYWNGRNDSGFPVSIELSLPAGFAADPTIWPAPKRNLMPGDILDHIYEDRVTLVIPIHIPSDAKPGARARFNAHLEWMECSRVCLLADGDVTLDLPIAEGAAPPSPDAELFADARGRTPVPLPEHPTDITLTWQEGGLRVESAGAEYMAFYPALDGLALIDAAHDGETRTGTLNLQFEGGPGSRGKVHVRGVLEVRRPGIAPVFYSLDLIDGQTGGSPQPAPDPAGIR